MNVIEKKISEIIPYENNPRNNHEALQYVKASIEAFGFRVPIVIDREGIIVAGHTRYEAALELNYKKIPCIIADDLTPEQIQAFRLVDNKTQELASWNLELLSEELSIIEGINMQEFGFMPSSYQQIEKMFDKDKEAVKTTDGLDQDEEEDLNFEYPDEDDDFEKVKVKYTCPCCGKEFEVDE